MNANAWQWYIALLGSFLIPVSFACASDDVLLLKGERISGDVTYISGVFKAGNAQFGLSEVLAIRFSNEPPPEALSGGIFLRGGTLLTGSLIALIGDTAEATTTTFGTIKIKRDVLTGAFTPPPAGRVENVPELLHYSNLLASALGASDAVIKPGQRCRIRMASLDEITPEAVMRIGAEQILVKGGEPFPRKNVRLIELPVPAAPPATPDETRLGPEVIFRLLSGDLIRGRLLKLDAQSLVVHTDFLGERTLDRHALAALFIAGGPGSYVTWLAHVKPKKAVQTPMFDAEFPARMDASIDRNVLCPGGTFTESGIGVHSYSELEYALPGTPARFVALCGMDAETRGRGNVDARVLADGKELWKSAAPLTGKDQPQLLSLDLGQAKTLTLQVDYGSDNDDSGDHFDWGWAAIISR